MNFKQTLSTIALGASILMASINPAVASEIAVSSVSASSTFHTYNVNNLINGSGISGAFHDGNWQNKWITNGTTTGSLVFDLGSAYSVASTTIWNYGTGCCGAGRSVKDLGISYSTDGINYSSFANVVLGLPATDPFLGESLALNFNARYIQFALNSNYGDAYTGLSEVKFFSGNIAPVPEPETYAMLLAGLGLMGAVARRRKQAA